MGFHRVGGGERKLIRHYVGTCGLMTQNPIYGGLSLARLVSVGCCPNIKCDALEPSFHVVNFLSQMEEMSVGYCESNEKMCNSLRGTMSEERRGKT